jgi:hypothetical protein
MAAKMTEMATRVAAVAALVLFFGAAAGVAACCVPVASSTPVEFQTCGGNRYAGLPFASRSPVYARQGAAASSVALASQVRAVAISTDRRGLTVRGLLARLRWTCSKRGATPLMRPSPPMRRRV